MINYFLTRYSWKLGGAKQFLMLAAKRKITTGKRNN